MKVITLRVRPSAAGAPTKSIHVNPDSITSFEHHPLGSHVWFKASESPLQVIEHPNDIEQALRMTGPPARSPHEIDMYNLASEMAQRCRYQLNAIHNALLLVAGAIALLVVVRILEVFNG